MGRSAGRLEALTDGHGTTCMLGRELDSGTQAEWSGALPPEPSLWLQTLFLKKKKCLFHFDQYKHLVKGQHVGLVFFFFSELRTVQGDSRCLGAFMTNI